MPVSKQFKLFNLKKMRKLCTDEVRGFKIKEMKKKNVFCNFIFLNLTALFWLLLWLCIPKMIGRA